MRVLGGALVALLLAAAPAAADVHVTSPADSGAGTLRQAIAAAAPGETVVIDPGVDPILASEIKIDKSVTIRGQGPDATAISGANVTRVFNVGSVTAGILVRIEALEITEGRAANGTAGAPETPGSLPAGHGSPGGNGGAIVNAANDLTLVDVDLVGNSAGIGGAGGPAFLGVAGNGGAGGNGGALANSGSAAILDSSLVDNLAGGGGAAGLSGSFGVVAVGGPAGGGGAVWNTGTLTVSSSTFSGNDAASGRTGETNFSAGFGFPGYPGGNGGAILSSGNLTVTGSTLTGNAAGSGGGGGFSTTNSGAGGAGGSGGAIFSSGIVRVVNATLAGNSAGDGGAGAFGTTIAGFGGTGGNGGGIATGAGSATLVGVTLSGNAAGDGGPAGAGGIPTPILPGAAGGGGGLSGAITVRGSILAGNSGATANCGGAVVGAGGNIAFPEAGGCLGFTVADPRLDPAGPAANGGPTDTIALLPGSAAVDMVPSALCVDAGGSPLATDQRGVARPQGTACDAGAFELVQQQQQPSSQGPPTTPAILPDTQIVGKSNRRIKTAKKRVRIKLAFKSSSPGSAFECKLDKRPFRPCTSPKTYRLKPGAHQIKVRALLAGAADPTPATVTVKVVRLAQR